MKKIIFVCHGSICRSPVAEFVMKSLTNKLEIISRALSYEEIGNDIYPPMKRVLLDNKIPFTKHASNILTMEDYLRCDYLFYMDDNNKVRLKSILNNDMSKCFPITFYSDNINEIEDPYYTGNYRKVFEEIKVSCLDILSNIEK